MAVSRNAFAARAFALQNGQNLGWIYFAPVRSALTRAKTSYALPPHHPPSFWPLSPEAPSADTFGTTRCFFCNEICSQKFCSFFNSENGAALLNTFEKSFTCEKF
ncbi:hypothetical protein ACFGVS_13635 [Mucilaginibacter sp. AW1-7]|uniref:hypothetical protein n=1 Tax=Mucilaginibacter sp. AW1-7 TaxID=3349874 RepID=UPI003F737795